jgi:hypothetical protein
MKTISKKTKGILIAAVCLCLVVAVAVVTGLELDRYNTRLAYNLDKYEVTNFKSNKEAFDIVAQKVMELCDEEYGKHDEIPYITVYASEATWKLTYRENAKSSESITVLYEATQQEQDAYNQASSLIAQTPNTSSGIMFIKVLRDRAFFYTKTPYAIIYMRNGGKPTYMYYEGEGTDAFTIYVEKLAPKWYQAIEKLT